MKIKEKTPQINELVKTPQLNILSAIITKFNYGITTIPFEHKAGAINYNVDPAVGFNLEMNQANVDIEIIAKVVSTDEEFFTCAIAFIYGIPDLKNIIEINTENIIIFKNKALEGYVVQSLIGVSYSTLRGIIMEKCSGTILQTNLLPVINPATFLRKQEPI